MRHLVTGGAGFLGNLIAKRLSDFGEDVTVLDIWDDPLRPEKIDFIKCDIRDESGVEKAMKGMDIVHHNVALVPLTKSGDEFKEVNVEGSRIAAAKAKNANVKAFIHMSSSALFGVPDDGPIMEDTIPNPIEIYGKSKHEGELVVKKIFENSETSLIIIRPRTILGEGRLGIFQILFEWIQENRNIYTIGDGGGKFQFVHAHDLMDAYMLVLNNGESGIYNVGAAEYGTLKEALDNLIDYAGSSSKVKSLPASFTINTLKILDILGLSPLAPWHYLTYHKPFYFNVDKLIDMGWKPKYSNDKLLTESFDWYIKNKYNKPTDTSSSIHRSPVKQKLLSILKKLS